MERKTIDKQFLTIVGILIGAGFFIFSSAALGLLARGDSQLSSTMLNQLIGLVVGVGALLITIRIPYRFWNKFAFYIFIGAVITTLAVFIPGVGQNTGGAIRWLSIGAFSFQPAELLKIAFVIYFSAWISGVKQKFQTFSHGVIPLVVLVSITGAILSAQPDLGTFLVIGITAIGMFVIGGGKWSHLLILLLIGVIGISILGFAFPYVQSRISTFINPASDTLGASYQIQQSLIAVGSGQAFGRGFGQSVQKFNFLPEPVGDSIFAVFAEEWGFFGALFLITLYLALGLRGFKIAARAPNTFAAMMVSGFILLILVQSFINIASMLGILPLTGMPLLFVSQGGSALMTTLAAVGIILNVSLHINKG